MQLHTFTASPGNTETSFKIEQSIQELDTVRTGPVSVFALGLLAGLPEIISTEITHPVRDRARGADNVPLAYPLLWGQHGRGPLLETVEVPNQPGDGLLTYVLKARYYIGDQGPIEILADDHFTVTVRNLIPGCTYDFYGPEQQLLGEHANKYLDYEMGIILATDRDRRLQVAGKQGIIFPNRPDIIQDIILTTVDGNGNKADKKLVMEEMTAAQTDANPNVLQLQYKSADPAKRDTDFMDSASADLVLIMFNGVQSILIDNILGNELRYVIVSNVDRA
ncbi:MAG: hypothetical protein ACRYFX_12710 [Janthinobacterium lividum]